MPRASLRWNEPVCSALVTPLAIHLVQKEVSLTFHRDGRGLYTRKHIKLVLYYAFTVFSYSFF